MTVVPLGFDLYVNLRWNAAWRLQRSADLTQALSSPASLGGSSSKHWMCARRKLNSPPLLNSSNSVITHHVIILERLYYTKYYSRFGWRVRFQRTSWKNPMHAQLEKQLQRTDTAYTRIYITRKVHLREGCCRVRTCVHQHASRKKLPLTTEL